MHMTDLHIGPDCSCHLWPMPRILVSGAYGQLSARLAHANASSDLTISVQHHGQWLAEHQQANCTSRVLLTPVILTLSYSEKREGRTHHYFHLELKTVQHTMPTPLDTSSEEFFQPGNPFTHGAWTEFLIFIPGGCRY